MAVTEAGAIEIIALDRVEIALEPWRWEFAIARREDIGRHFAERQRAQPQLWNGRVLLVHRYAFTGDVLRGACFETDYANLLTWVDWGLPDASVFNLFAAAAVRSAEGAYLVGEMAPTTAAPGQLTFPCGTPDVQDLRANGALDLDFSLGRELVEETGLEMAALTAEPGWVLVRDRGYLALMKRLTAREDAATLRARILRHLQSDAHAELSDIRIVRERADLDPRMPRFLVTYLEEAWRRG
ncbi:MAG: NUDIX hydrolase [Xanthobacteraceae bacterium]|nr:NUDIX hydrolase [Xanthobacteraceae bacterium]